MYHYSLCFYIYCHHLSPRLLTLQPGRIDGKLSAAESSELSVLCTQSNCKQDRQSGQQMMVGGRIADLVIRVTGAEGLASWYTRVLGMTEGGQLDSNTWTAKFPGQSVRLVFQVKSGW